jgi:nitronate monooxygenase
MLGIPHPVVLGPFGGVSSVELTSRVSELGGLGSYGLYGYDADRILETAARLRDATSRPVALNLWVPLDDVDEVSREDFARYAEALGDLYEEVGVPTPTPPERYLPSFDDQLAAVLEARPAAVSFVYGVPPADAVAAAHERDIVVVGTATTVDEAVALEAGGVDVVVASGAEAAGHRVSFLAPAEESLVGTLPLVPQVVDAVRVPVVAAGGIADRRGVAAALALGAAGVQVGTAFLRTRQSAASEAHRRAIAEASAHGTVLTRAMSGRLARGIPNRAVRRIEERAIIAPFPVQNWLTARFRTEAARRERGDLLSLWAGQAAPLARHDDATTLFAELIAGT